MAEEITVTQFIAKRIEVKEDNLTSLDQRIATLKQGDYTSQVGKELDTLINKRASLVSQLESLKSI